MPTLYIMRGLPGSGKSTKAKEIAEKTGAFITSLDNMREYIAGSRDMWHSKPAIFKKVGNAIAQVQYSMIELHLSNGEDVIVDNMNLRIPYLKKLKEIAKEYNAEIKIVEMKEDWATLKERNHTRPIQERVNEDWLYEMYKTYNRLLLDGRFK